jgi:ABC-type nitrate/sulfonate/bicarbonate transport system ATPase subunit
MHTTREAPLAEPHSIPDRPRSGEDGAAANQVGRRVPVAVATGGLAHSFGELRVIERIDADVRSGELLGVVGPSGCGKSTLLELVCGLRDPTAGSIEVEGERSPARRLDRCAYMPQRDLLLPWMRAIDNAALALRNRGVPRRAARRAAAPLFERFGLEGFERARPSELSGGMRQRVAFLRTLLAGKPVLLLDEPFAGLDAITRTEMQEWLAGALDGGGRTALLVTHDVEEALYLADRVLVLSRRPATIVAELRSPAPRARPRRDAVTSLAFVEARERALAALLEGGRG